MRIKILTPCWNFTFAIEIAYKWNYSCVGVMCTHKIKLYIVHPELSYWPNAKKNMYKSNKLSDEQNMWIRTELATKLWGLNLLPGSDSNITFFCGRVPWISRHIQQLDYFPRVLPWISQYIQHLKPISTRFYLVPRPMSLGICQYTWLCVH